MKKLSRDSLEGLPGIGPAIAQDLRRLGIARPADLLALEAEELFARLVALDGPTDRCVLYTFRCARYFVATSDADLVGERLRWWTWKDTSDTGERVG